MKIGPDLVEEIRIGFGEEKQQKTYVLKNIKSRYSAGYVIRPSGRNEDWV